MSANEMQTFAWRYNMFDKKKRVMLFLTSLKSVDCRTVF